MDEPGEKRGAYVWLLSLLYGRGLMGTATKILYGAMAFISASCAWWFLTAAAYEATGISISKRILISAFFVVLTIGMIAMVRSVDQLPPPDADSEQNPP